MAKGSDFERVIAKKLSSWWTNGERDDVFWRTVTSGGWATSRSRMNKGSSQQYGDLTVIDPIGQPLIQACCIELKIGYGKWSFLDAVDKADKGKDQTIELFLKQCYEQWENSGARWPVLIAKRDMRVPVIIFPRSMYFAIEEHYGVPEVQFPMVLRIQYTREPMICFRLGCFLNWCSPEFFTSEMWKEGMDPVETVDKLFPEHVSRRTK